MESTAFEHQLRNTGLEIIGSAPWGTHFCNFFNFKEDLLDILVPYFRAGWEDNDFCLSITSDPVSVDYALARLHDSVPLFDKYLTIKAVEVHPKQAR